MPYKTKPYIAWGLGQAFRAIEYVIDEERIKEIGLISGNIRASIKREGASIIRIDDNGQQISGLRNVFNFGNLLVTNASSRHVFKNVPDIKSFMLAVEGRHPDVYQKTSLASPQSEIMGIQKIPTRETEPDMTLGSALVCVPAIPYPIYREIQKHSSNSNYGLIWLVNEGQFVQNGQVIAQLSARPLPNAYYGQEDDRREIIASITAPCAGKFLYGKARAIDWPYKPDYFKNPEVDYAALYTPENILFSIHRFKRDEGKNCHIGLGYSAYKDVVRYVYSATGLTSQEDRNNPANLRFHIEQLANAYTEEKKVEPPPVSNSANPSADGPV